MRRYTFYWAIFKNLKKYAKTSQFKVPAHSKRKYDISTGSAKDTHAFSPFTACTVPYKKNEKSRTISAISRILDSC